MRLYILFQRFIVLVLGVMVVAAYQSGLKICRRSQTSGNDNY
jgi:hypothetical protein